MTEILLDATEFLVRGSSQATDFGIRGPVCFADFRKLFQCGLDHVQLLREADGFLDGLLRLDGQAQDERAVNHHAGFVAILREAAHLVGGHAFLDARESFVVAAFVADEEQAQAVVFETFDRVVIEVRAAVAAPMVIILEKNFIPLATLPIERATTFA